MHVEGLKGPVDRQGAKSCVRRRTASATVATCAAKIGGAATRRPDCGILFDVTHSLSV